LTADIAVNAAHAREISALAALTRSAPCRTIGGRRATIAPRLPAARGDTSTSPRRPSSSTKHVEADRVHEAIAAVDVAGGLARAEPGLTGDLLWGARARRARGALVAALLRAWERGESSLRTALSDRIPRFPRRLTAAGVRRRGRRAAGRSRAAGARAAWR